ncbi:YciI family protein [Pelagibius marinus]|uniref:YciI family protein n=1 Tax=Pelagibius marinus TaxID=2762760 RepID=UPI001872434E|nr:YciI family protein [Pelagibius marinus]
MKYMLCIYVDESAQPAAAVDAPHQMSPAFAAYVEALRESGILVGGDRLKPTETATTLRVVDGEAQVLDGPYADTKEQLAGYLVIDVPDIDSALSWAARCPGASRGTLEVRPIWE